MLSFNQIPAMKFGVFILDAQPHYIEVLNMMEITIVIEMFIYNSNLEFRL